MSKIELIDVLHVMPKNEDYTIEEINPTLDTVKELLGGEVDFVEIGSTVGFFAKQLKRGDERPLENFVISVNAEITEEVYGSVAFLKFEDERVLRGLTDAEMEVIASNLLETQSGQRVLFLDVIAQELEDVQ